MPKYHATRPWTPTRPRSLEDAIALATEHILAEEEEGLRQLPDYLDFRAPDEPDRYIPKDALASYCRLADLEILGLTPVKWGGGGRDDFQLLHHVTGKLPVRLRPCVLESEEAIVAVIAHEVYEIVHLRLAFADNRDVLLAGVLYQLIHPDVDRNLHHRAVAFGDRLVLKMRGQ